MTLGTDWYRIGTRTRNGYCLNRNKLVMPSNGTISKIIKNLESGIHNV
ncbi:hypothetical protein GNI_019640 [Gregarina niphandrodes]|uniref:Uncharacterized protein n=1 Tax=Gregarina niphandrodes TaxID=110365 RepID=A0A023BC23_GRENI|nr:hypothetical protein GNI_019640 [Gregarina niphandrodes]EZG81188.1 hypothetical protein GNI_019640 [Gregarina niphandrodes]|eukprot:XP_011134246.1 hypothetical protein GNI_019640 [Gregarina niphandrodes]